MFVDCVFYLDIKDNKGSGIQDEKIGDPMV